MISPENRGDYPESLQFGDSDIEAPMYLRVTDNCEVEILWEGCGTDYRISLDQIDTQERLIACILQLADKVWITPLHIGALVKFAVRRNNWKVRGIV